tara:strand:- start:1297 stop:1848 length:552 start_codon:yes stop_codon:yes gene_type:complete
LNNKIEIPISKKKIVLLLIGVIILVIGAVLMTVEPERITLFHRKGLILSPETVRIIGVVGIVFCGTTGVFFIKKLFDKKVGLIIDEKGITDNSSALSIGLIEWKDINGIELTQVNSIKFLRIGVKNPEEYISKAKNGIKAKIMKINMNMYGSPIYITSNSLKYNFEELETIVQSEFKKNKNAR